MKTLSLEASIELQDYMPEETEYRYFYDDLDLIKDEGINLIDMHGELSNPKTLTLEEAIDMLPKAIDKKNNWMKISKYKDGLYYVEYGDLYFCGKKLIEPVESMLLYLHKQNLLG